MAKVMLYGRNSGETQEKAETIETQRKLLLEWARKEGHDVVGTYWDEAVRSVVPIADREEGGRLLRDLPRKRPDFVACYKLSRWSRYADVWHAGRNELRRYGTDLLCLHDDTRDSNAGERFSLGVRLLVSEDERDNIEHTCLDGRYTWAAEGYYSGGVVPYGYRPVPDPERRAGKKVRSILAIDEVEAEVVRGIFVWCVEERLSCVAIARRLSDQGVPRASATPDPERHRPPGSSLATRWNHGTVAGLLHAPYYKGTGTFGKVCRTRRDPVAVAYPAIVDADLWQAAQAQLDRNRIMSPQGRKHDYLLRGLIHCVDCNRTLGGWNNGREGLRCLLYYVCPGRYQPPRGRGHCPLPYIPAAALEQNLWDTLAPLVRDRERTVGQLREQARQGERDRGALQASCDGLRGAIERKRLQLQRGLDLLTDENIAVSDYHALRDRINPEIERLAVELQRQHAVLQFLEIREQRVEGVAVWLGRWRESVEDPTWATKRRVIEELLDAVELTLDGDVVRVTYVFCFDPEGRADGVATATPEHSIATTSFTLSQPRRLKPRLQQR